MDARSLYDAAKQRKGIGGALRRLLVFVYVVARKPAGAASPAADGD